MKTLLYCPSLSVLASQGLTDHGLLSPFSMQLLRGINGTSMDDCVWLLSFILLFFHLFYHLFFDSSLTPSSSFCTSRQWNSSEVRHPGGRHGPIQHLQLPALRGSLRVRASRRMGRESESEQRSDSLAQRGGAHFTVQRPLWTQRDEENAGR